MGGDYQAASPNSAARVFTSRASLSTALNAEDTSHDNRETRIDPERQRDLDEEQSGAELSYAARGQGSSNTGTPFYTGNGNSLVLMLHRLIVDSGEQPGVTSLIDVQQPFQRHIMLKPNPPSALSQAEREFLQRKGALKPLLVYSHRALLRAYFHHVHPMLPILHLTKLQDLESPDLISPQGMLLFWSMAVVAVNVRFHHELLSVG
jgi:hypothetical protein